jgi:hypothetical protein
MFNHKNFIMKTRIFLIAMLLSVTPFLQSAKSYEAKAVKKLVWTTYCGYVSVGCGSTPTSPGGPIEVVIASDGTTAYLQQVTVAGSSIPFSVISITPSFGANVFSVNFNYLCPSASVWNNYTGGAYTLECP